MTRRHLCHGPSAARAYGTFLALFLSSIFLLKKTTFSLVCTGAFLPRNREFMTRGYEGGPLFRAQMAVLRFGGDSFWGAAGFGRITGPSPALSALAYCLLTFSGTGRVVTSDTGRRMAG